MARAGAAVLSSTVSGMPCWVGVDPGATRVGLAVSDATRALAFPLGAVATEPRATLGQRIRDQLGARDVLRIVVGLPLTERGHEGPAAILAREIGQVLAVEWGLAPEYCDERFSSRAAERDVAEVRSHTRQRFGRQQRAEIKQSGQLDALAATQILQSYLDQARR